MSARSRYLLYASLSTLIGIGASLVLAEIGLRYYSGYVQSQEHMDPGFLLYDAGLGWRLAPNWHGHHIHYDFNVDYTTNAAGLRGAAWPAADTSRGQRIAIVGDSFTFGLGVDDDATFVQRLQTADTRNTYLNASIPGYSTDQQLLYLQEHLASWHVNRLVLVVYLVNDLLDNELRFPLQAEMGKPLFLATPAGLDLTNVPVPRAPKPPGERARSLATMVLGDAVASSWRNELQLSQTLGLAESADPALLAGMPQRLAGPVDLFVQLIAEMRELCAANNVALTIALLPGRSYVEMPESLSAAFQEELRRQILLRQSELGGAPIDLASQLRKRYEATGERLFFQNEGHLNSQGHRIVAELLRAGLAQQVAAGAAAGG
jgi:lysophospholipase L1-like esterase